MVQFHLRLIVVHSLATCYIYLKICHNPCSLVAFLLEVANLFFFSMFFVSYVLY